MHFRGRASLEIASRLPFHQRRQYNDQPLSKDVASCSYTNHDKLVHLATPIPNQMLLGLPPPRGEPAQPRGATAPQRRRSVDPQRAVCNRRNHKRGLRSKDRTDTRKSDWSNRIRRNRTLFRQFKQFSINYTLKQTALEMRRRLYLWRRLGRPEKRRQFEKMRKQQKKRLNLLMVKKSKLLLSTSEDLKANKRKSNRNS